MRCYRCKRHGKLVTMVKYGDGTARCPKCGRTIHYEPRKRRRNDSDGNLVYTAVSMILFGFAAAIIKLWQITLPLWAIAGIMIAIEFLAKRKD